MSAWGMPSYADPDYSDALREILFSTEVQAQWDEEAAGRGSAGPEPMAAVPVDREGAAEECRVRFDSAQFELRL